VGTARFSKALAGFGRRKEVEVVYRSFELDPGWPAGQTMPILEMLASKYRLSVAEAEAAEARVAGLAREEGLGFRTDRMLGNTFDIHRVLHLGRAQGFQHQLMEAIYGAYFAGAEPVFEAETLAAVAATAGLDPDDVKQTLAGDDFADEVRGDEQRARELGITGVPFFVFDGRRAVSGAQPAAAFIEILGQAIAE
jgi:predicted DsbA family dithiol-disulfide isomerase